MKRLPLKKSGRVAADAGRAAERGPRAKLCSRGRWRGRLT